MRPYLKTTHHKKVAQGVGPDFKSQYHKEKRYANISNLERNCDVIHTHKVPPIIHQNPGILFSITIEHKTFEL
jgi:hypothetical protein